MRTIGIIVEYDGAAFRGWQIQDGDPTVQEALEHAVEQVTGAFSRVEGSGRTDSGVHALGQVASFETASAMPGPDFARALDAHLPKTVSVRRSAEMAAGFHARFSAVGKHYRYLIENAPTRPVLDRHRVWWVTWRLDDDALAAATAPLAGRRDFTSFAAAERKDEDNVRTVVRAEWTRIGNRLLFDIEGEGFLYKMVRCVVGTVVEAGRGALDPAAVPRILDARSREAAGPTAPPQGLHLVSVRYPPEHRIAEGGDD